MKIETVADKLLQLVKTKKKISFKDCSKQLKVPENLIEEWTQFLEDEGLVDIEYKLATPYIVEKAMSKEEESQKIEKISKKRDFFVEKELESIDLGSSSEINLENLKQTFGKIKEALQIELDAIREELEEIKEFEKEEKKFERESEEGKKYFLQKINAITKKLVDDEKELSGFESKFETDYGRMKDTVVEMSANLKNAANWIKYLGKKTGDQEKRLVKIEKAMKKWK